MFFAKIPQTHHSKGITAFPIWTQYPNRKQMLKVYSLGNIFEKIVFQCHGDTGKQCNVDIFLAQYLMHIGAGSVDSDSQIGNGYLFAFQHLTYALPYMYFDFCQLFSCMYKKSVDFFLPDIKGYHALPSKQVIPRRNTYDVQ